MSWISLLNEPWWGSVTATMTMPERVIPEGSRSRPDRWVHLASFVSLAYSIGANLVAVPIYIGFLGSEAYGLIGFYALLTAGFQVVDVGLSATMTRECARFRGGALDGAALWRLLNGLEIVFVTLVH